MITLVLDTLNTAGSGLFATTQNTIEFITAITGVGAAIGIGIYAYKNSINKEVKKSVIQLSSSLPNIEENILTTKNELLEIKKHIIDSDTNNTDDHKKIFNHINTTTEIVKNLLIKNDVDNALNTIIGNAHLYTDKYPIMAAFFELCGVLVKDFTNEIIKISIDKLTKEEIAGKIQYMRFQIREFYAQFEPDFVEIVLPKLTSYIEEYEKTLIEIKTDIINDKSLRVKLASVALLQHTYSYMVQERIKYKKK